MPTKITQFEMRKCAVSNLTADKLLQELDPIGSKVKSVYIDRVIK